MVLGVWILVLAGIGSLAGKLESAEKNESSSFLPGSAESSKVLKDVRQFPGGETAAAVILYRRDGGLTPRDLAQIQAARARLNRNLPPSVLAAPPIVVSRDHTTALLVPQLKFTGHQNIFEDAVKGVNRQTTFAAPGLMRKLTGPAGFSHDAIKVFGNISGTLLLVTAGLVFVLLVLIYRSPIFWLIPFSSVLFAEATARGIAYLLAKAGVVVNGQSAGILPVLVFGAGTDYALLLVARYREELRRHVEKRDALRVALRRAGVPILASGCTVILALLCLSFAKVNGTSGLGPIAAMGIAVAMIAMLTLLPALLAIFGGRKAFWPRIPRHGDSGADETHGFWRRVGEWVARHPRRVTAGTVALLLVFALGLLAFNTNLTQANGFRGHPESVQGQKLLQAAFPAGASVPVDIIVPPGGNPARVIAAVKRVPGVATASVVSRGPPGLRLQATLSIDPYSVKAYDLIPDIRKAAKAGGGDGVLVGGGSAQEADLRTAAAQDTRLIVPLALAVVFVILVLLLRAVVAPLLLIGDRGPVLRRGPRDRLVLRHRGVRLRRPGPVLSVVRVRVPGRAGHRLQHLPDGARARGDRALRHAHRHAARPRGDRRGDHVGRHRAGRDVLGPGRAAARVPHRARLHDRDRRAARHVPRALDPRARAHVRLRRPRVVAVTPVAPRGLSGPGARARGAAGGPAADQAGACPGRGQSLSARHIALMPLREPPP